MVLLSVTLAVLISVWQYHTVAVNCTYSVYSRTSKAERVFTCLSAVCVSSSMVCLSWRCRSVVSDSLWRHGLQHTRFPCLSPSPGVCSNSCPSSQWCHPTISSSVIPFSCPQSFPASGSPVSWLFASGDQSVGASALASVLPLNIQCWFPLELTGLISLMLKGLLRVFSSITVWKHQFFGAQPSLWSNSHVFIYMTTGKISIHDFHLFLKIWMLFFNIEFWGFCIF